MLLNINQIPATTRLCKVLTTDRIRMVSTPINGLQKPCKEILEPVLLNSILTTAFMDVCWKMVKTCIREDGIGLTACQIGVFKSLFIMRENDSQFKVYLNPSYTVNQESKSELGQEGCLSVPGKRLMVPRHTKIDAVWWEVKEENETSPKCIFLQEKVLEGFEARVFQHEMSHVLGRNILMDSVLKHPFTPSNKKQ